MLFKRQWNKPPTKNFYCSQLRLVTLFALLITWIIDAKIPLKTLCFICWRSSHCCNSELDATKKSRRTRQESNLRIFVAPTWSHKSLEGIFFQQHSIRRTIQHYNCNFVRFFLGLELGPRPKIQHQKRKFRASFVINSFFFWTALVEFNLQHLPAAHNQNVAMLQHGVKIVS